MRSCALMSRIWEFIHTGIPTTTVVTQETGRGYCKFKSGTQQNFADLCAGQLSTCKKILSSLCHWSHCVWRTRSICFSISQGKELKMLRCSESISANMGLFEGIKCLLWGWRFKPRKLNANCNNRNERWKCNGLQPLDSLKIWWNYAMSALEEKAAECKKCSSDCPNFPGTSRMIDKSCNSQSSFCSHRRPSFCIGWCVLCSWNSSKERSNQKKKKNKKERSISIAQMGEAKKIWKLVS